MASKLIKSAIKKAATKANKALEEKKKVASSVGSTTNAKNSLAAASKNYKNAVKASVGSGLATAKKAASTGSSSLTDVQKNKASYAGSAGLAAAQKKQAATLAASTAKKATSSASAQKLPYTPGTAKKQTLPQKTAATSKKKLY